MILRTELRRSTAPVLAIGFLVVSLGLIYSLSGPWHKGTAAWNEEWTGLAQWTRYLTLFLWPLVLGVGAWQGMRDHRSRVDELFSTTPKPPWRRMLVTTAAMVIALTAAYVVLLVAGGVQVAGTTNYFHLKWVPLAVVMVLALSGMALLGAGIGRLLPSPVTPPVLAVAALAAQIAVLQSNWILLTPAFESIHISVFTTVDVLTTATQALWFVGMGATGYLLFVATRARARVVAVLPVVVAGAVAVAELPSSDPVVPDLDATALVCDEHGPRVCVSHAHADRLRELTGPARQALVLLAKLPSPPTSVVELTSVDEPGPSVRPPDDVVRVHLETPPLSDPAQLRWVVIAASSSRTCESRGTEEDVDFYIRSRSAEIIVWSWLAGELKPVSESEFPWEEVRAEIQRAWRALRALPSAEQAERVAGLRDALLDCRDVDLSTL